MSLYLIKASGPNRMTWGLFILVGLLSSIRSYGIYYTTKITWEEYRGLPFSFVKLSGCFGPCYPDSIGLKFVVQALDTYALIQDALIWFLIARLIAWGIAIVMEKEKTRDIVTGKR
jgi:hypothetical protein